MGCKQSKGATGVVLDDQHTTRTRNVSTPGPDGKNYFTEFTSPDSVMSPVNISPTSVSMASASQMMNSDFGGHYPSKSGSALTSIDANNHPSASISSIQSPAGSPNGGPNSPQTMNLLHQRLAFTLKMHTQGPSNRKGNTAQEEEREMLKFWDDIARCATNESSLLLNYVNNTNISTPLHEACKLPYLPVKVLEHLYEISGGSSANALDKRDQQDNIPLHYAITSHKKQISTEVINFLLANTSASVQQSYLASYQTFDMTIEGKTRKCSVTPLYRAAQIYMPKSILLVINRECPRMLCTPVMVSGDDNSKNDSGDDTPLFLLWRRYQNYKWQSEKFFDGDNSRQEVVDHRRKYSALSVQALDAVLGSIQMLSPGGTMLHSAATIACVAPPGLLTFILDKFGDQAAVLNSRSQYPLHLASESTTAGSNAECYQGKFVIDTLLRLYPAAVEEEDEDGRLPLVLAIESGRTTENGVRSLYDAYPAAFDEAAAAATSARDKYDLIREAMSVISDPLNDDENEDDEYDFQKDAKEVNKAIFIVQNPKVDVRDLVGSMVSDAEDAAVQMLGCLSLAERASRSVESATCAALCGGIDAVVNAMNYHPNEPVVQEKACAALRQLAAANNRHEISFASVGATLSIISAMKDHPGDPLIQESASLALGNVGTNSDSATTIFSAGGIAAIVNALGAHPDDLGVQRRAVEALKKLTDASSVDLPVAREEIIPLLEAAARYDNESRASVEVLLERLS